MSDEPQRVKVIYDDQPVHCIDVEDGLGNRLLRIRRQGEYVTIKRCPDLGPSSASISLAEADELARALDKLATRTTAPQGMKQVGHVDEVGGGRIGIYVDRELGNYPEAGTPVFVQEPPP